MKREEDKEAKPELQHFLPTCPILPASDLIRLWEVGAEKRERERERERRGKKTLRGREIRHSES